MPQVYRAHGFPDPIDTQDGTPVLKSAASVPAPSPTDPLEDGDLTVPADLVVEICPPGVAQGVCSWAWRSSDGIGATGRRTPAQGGA